MPLLSQISKNKQGVTLPELMISMAILSTIVVLWWVMNNNTAYYGTMNSQLNIQNAGKSALNLMSKEIRGANSIGQALITSPPAAPAITFRTTRVLDNGTVVNGVVRYSLDSTTINQTLLRERFPAATAIPIPANTIPVESAVILEQVEDISFNILGSRVMIDFTVHTPFGGRAAQRRFTTDVCVRNP